MNYDRLKPEKINRFSKKKKLITLFVTFTLLIVELNYLLTKEFNLQKPLNLKKSKVRLKKNHHDLDKSLP